MTRLIHSFKLISAAYLGIVLASTPVAGAQALAIGHRASELTPFGQFTYLKPDWGQGRNLGFSTGADYTRLVPLIIQPSLEVRFTNATGPQAMERTFAGGVKLAGSIGRVHPYGTFLKGFGIITFNNPTVSSSGYVYARDSSQLYSAGGGVDLDVDSCWKMRFDFSRQFWNLAPPVMTPTAVSVGIAYKLPFGQGPLGR